MVETGFSVPKLDVKRKGVDIEEDFPAFEEINISSPLKSKDIPINLDSPVQYFLDSESDNSDGLENAPISNPQSPSGSFIDFDNEIKQSIVEMICDSSQDDGIEMYIANNWYDLMKMPAGIPGIQLGQKLMMIDKELVGETYLEQVFSRLDDIRTTTGSREAILMLFASTVALFHAVRGHNLLMEFSLRFVDDVLSTAYNIIGNSMFEIYLSSILLPQNDGKLKKYSNQLLEFKQGFRTETEWYLYQRMIDYVDCHLANHVISTNSISSLSQALRANTNISTFETDGNPKLPIFREILLVFIAFTTILDGSTDYKQIVPLIPPNVIYLILCNLKPDEMLPERIDYKLLDSFMVHNNCNLSIQQNGFLFSPRKSLPEELDKIKMPTLNNQS